MASDSSQLVIDALRQLDIDARPALVPDERVDLVIDPWGIELRTEVKRRALVTEETARRLVETPWPANADDSGADSLRVVVADRVTAAARQVLLGQHWGYLDLRGHLGLRAERLIIDADVDPLVAPPIRTAPLAGKVGLEVAAAILMEPERGQAVRELARELNRSASTVSQVLAALRDEHLVDQDHRVSDTRLFWAMADRWPADRIYLELLPPTSQRDVITLPLRLGLEDVERTSGWALTDAAAAAALGAPVAVRTDQPLDFFVPDQATSRRARTLLTATTSRELARCSVRVAPVPAVCDRRVDAPDNSFEWPTAHPLFVALDLAQDSGRGREILQDWTPPDRWKRVW